MISEHWEYPAPEFGSLEEMFRYRPCLRRRGQLDRAVASHWLESSRYWDEGEYGPTYAAWHLKSFSGNLDAHVFAGYLGTLAVMGDCKPCVWRTTGPAISRLLSIGRSNIGYTAEKAMCGGSTPYGFMAQQAAIEVLHLRRYNYISRQEAKDALAAARRDEVTLEQINDLLINGESVKGEVATPAYLQSLAVVRRCAQLVRASLPEDRATLLETTDWSTL